MKENEKNEKKNEKNEKHEKMKKKKNMKKWKKWKNNGKKEKWKKMKKWKKWKKMKKIKKFLKMEKIEKNEKKWLKMMKKRKKMKKFAFTRKIFHDFQVYRCCCNFFRQNPRRFPWFCFGMCLFPDENQQPVLGGHRFFRRRVTIFIGRETDTLILQTKINEKKSR